MSKLVHELIRRGYLQSDHIIQAFSEVSRLEFVPSDLRLAAEQDIPLPIGYGQTISQPLTVAFMFELLDPRAGQNILDIGSGSGWTTALLAHIVGRNGHVTAIERIKKLHDFSQKNVNKFDFISKDGVEFVHGDGTQGYSKNAPYDRILVSAAADEVPMELKKQLKVGGKMVIPVNNDIWYLEKTGDEDEPFKREIFGGFSFVPLVENSTF